MPRKKQPTLARPGDPLMTRNGVLVDPELPRIAKAFEKLPAPLGERKPDSNIDPVAFRSSKRKNIKDLPAPPNIINGCAALFMYTVLGVGEREIADNLGITTMQLDELRNHSAFAECFKAVLDELISANSDALQARLSSYAVKAVDNIMHVAETAEKDETKLRANQDIADRAGIGAKQLAERRVGVQSTLRIMILDEEKTVDVKLDVGG